jgi:hypothetical protein
MAKDFASKTANHVKSFAVFFPIELGVLALPAVVPWFVALVTLSINPWIIDSGLATLNGKPLRNVFLKRDVDQDAVNLDSVRVRADSRREFCLSSGFLVCS